MACDATARLYDVNEDTAVFKRLQTTGKYDQGTFTFQARKGRLIDLDKLHESIWATRLSGGTRSGLVNLEVTAIGQVVSTNERTVLRVGGSEAEFVLAKHTDAEHTLAFGLLKQTDGARKVKLTGHIADYSGKWPKVLASKPTKPRRIMVTSFEVLEAQ